MHNNGNFATNKRNNSYKHFTMTLKLFTLCLMAMALCTDINAKTTEDQ